jgi:hypothetical protein
MLPIRGASVIGIEAQWGQKYMVCCGKAICAGCAVQLQNGPHYTTCPFCRQLVPTSNEECYEKLLKRVDAGDVDATYHLGFCYFYGDVMSSVKKDVDKAKELFVRAAELGYGAAYFTLALFFEEGKKANQYYETAALSGCAFARLKLGVVEADAGKFDRAVKHWVIAASQGMKEALDFIRVMVLEIIGQQERTTGKLLKCTRNIWTKSRVSKGKLLWRIDGISSVYLSRNRCIESILFGHSLI